MLNLVFVILKIYNEFLKVYYNAFKKMNYNLYVNNLNRTLYTLILVYIYYIGIIVNSNINMLYITTLK